MPDKWGRPTMEDWMGIANSIQSMSNARTTGEINKARLSDVKETQAYDAAYKDYLGRFQKDENYKLDPNEEGFHPKAAQAAHADTMAFKQKKMEYDLKDTSFRYNKAYESASKGMAKIVSATDEKGSIKDSKTYQKGYEEVLHTYDAFNDEWDFVENSIDYEKNTVRMKNHQTGKTDEIPLPSMDEVKSKLKPFFEMSGSNLNKSDEGFKTFLNYNLASAEDIKKFNLQQWENAETLQNEKGEVLKKARMQDFRGSGNMRTVYRNEATGEELTDEAGAKYVRENKFKPLKDIDAELGIEKKKADIAKSIAETEYTKGLKGRTQSDQQMIERIMRIDGSTEAEALKKWQKMQELDKTVNTRWTRFADEADGLDPNDPEDLKEMKELAKKFQVEDLVFGSTGKSSPQKITTEKPKPKEGTVIKNPNTGERMIMQNGSWKPYSANKEPRGITPANMPF